MHGSRIPRRIVEPLKLALAIVIIYAIAFYMGWSKPYWATVSAVSVNLLSSGLTVHRAAIRVLGTLAGGMLGILVIGMFPQERWAYLCAISVVLFILGYMATGKKEPYFYLIVLITFIVVMAVVQQSDYSDSGQAHQVVMLRVTQTLMGSAVMGVIMVFVFPYRTIDEFEDVARARWGIQRQLYGAYRGMLFGEKEGADTKHLRMEDAPLLEYCHFKLHGAEQDSFEMMEVAHDWHHYLDLTAAQYDALEALRQSLSEAGGLDLGACITNLEEVRDELDLRFEQTERMLKGERPARTARHISVKLDDAAARALPHLQEAEVRVIRRQLEALEEVSLSLYDCVANIRMFERPEGAHDDHHGHGHGSHGLALDPFRLTAAFAFVAAVWVAFLLWIYVYDMPRGSLFPCFVVIVASIAMYRPEANHIHYGLGWMVGVLAAGPFYVLIMHQFTSFLALALMVGAAIFTMQYLLYPHVHPIARIFTSIGFVIGIDAENQMHYDWQFYQQVVLWMGFAIVVSLAVRFAFIPRQPDVLFMKVLDQFFRHADFLLSERDADGRRDRSLSRRIRWIFHRHSLSEEAARLALFAGQVDPRTGRTTYRELRGATPEQVQELVRCVYALAHRVEAYVAAREESRSFAVDRHLLSEKQQWQRTVRDWFSRGPDAARADGPLGSLQERLVRLETRIEEAFVRVDDDEELSTEDYENFFVRLGNFRGLSEAAVDFARVAQGFDWPRWRETRF